MEAVHLPVTREKALVGRLVCEVAMPVQTGQMGQFLFLVQFFLRSIEMIFGQAAALCFPT